MGLYTAAERAAALDNGGEYAPVAVADTPKSPVPPVSAAAPVALSLKHI